MPFLAERRRDAVTSRHAQRARGLLVAAAPLVQERMTVLAEAARMLGFLFVDDGAVHGRRRRGGDEPRRGRRSRCSTRP